MRYHQREVIYFDIIDVLSAAIAVDRLTATLKPDNRGYSKSSYILRPEDIPADYRGSYGGSPYLFANRDLMKEHFGVGTLMKYNNSIVDGAIVVPEIVVTNEDRAEALAMRSGFLKALMVDSLNGKIEKQLAAGNDFKSNLNEILSNDKVESFALGIIACVPEAYRNELKNQELAKNKSRIAFESEFVGTVGQKLELDIEIQSSKFISQFSSFVYNAVANGKDAVTFFTAKEPEVFGNKCRITGKVKRTEVSDFSGAKETRLNYVKVIV